MKKQTRLADGAGRPGRPPSGAGQPGAVEDAGQVEDVEQVEDAERGRPN